MTVMKAALEKDSLEDCEIQVFEQQIQVFEQRIQEKQNETMKLKQQKAVLKQKCNQHNKAIWCEVAKAKKAQNMKQMAKWLSSHEAVKPYPNMDFGAIQKDLFGYDGLPAFTVLKGLERSSIVGLLNKCSNLGLGKHPEFTTRDQQDTFVKTGVAHCSKEQQDTFVKTGVAHCSKEQLANRLAAYCKMPLPFALEGPPPSVPDSHSVKTPDSKCHRLPEARVLDGVQEEATYTDGEM